MLLRFLHCISGMHIMYLFQVYNQTSHYQLVMAKFHIFVFKKEVHKMWIKWARMNEFHSSNLITASSSWITCVKTLTRLFTLWWACQQWAGLIFLLLSSRTTPGFLSETFFNCTYCHLLYQNMCVPCQIKQFGLVLSAIFISCKIISGNLSSW